MGSEIIYSEFWWKLITSGTQVQVRKRMKL